MAREIERKFLVDATHGIPTRRGEPYRQGYLSTDPARVVRVRTAGDAGVPHHQGADRRHRRPEYEYRIPTADAEYARTLCLRPLIDKIRYRID